MLIKNTLVGIWSETWQQTAVGRIAPDGMEQVESKMKMEISDHGPVTLAKPIDSRMDAASAVGFKTTMHGIAQSGAENVVLDLSRINFMDSSGLGALVAVLKEMAPDKKLEVAGLTPPLQKLFQLTRMDNVFKVYNTAGDAISDYEQKAD